MRERKSYRQTPGVQIPASPSISYAALAQVWIISAPVFTCVKQTHYVLPRLYQDVNKKERLGKQVFKTDSCVNHKQVANGEEKHVLAHYPMHKK